MSKGSDHSGFITTIEGQISENRIKDSFVKVIGKNQLLHCTLVEADGEQKWCEYEVDEIQAVMGHYLPYVNISMYAENVRENIISILCDQIMLRTYSEDELLWRLCVLKESSNKHIVIWGADHLIFDGMSAEIIKHEIEKELGKRTMDEAMPIRSYKEYIEVLDQGPVDMTEDELIDQFQLEKWSRNNSKVMEVPQEGSFQLKRNVELIIPLSDVEQADIWWFAFDLVSDILRNYTKIENIPFAFLDYARSYQSKDFYNTVGEFLDIVPVISSKEEKTYVESVIELCRNHSVNFLALLGEERFRKDYPKLNDLIGKYYYNDKEYCDFILYNFQGFVRAEEKKAFVHNNKDKSLSRMSVTVNYDLDHLYIELEDAAGLKEEEIRKYAEKIKL